MDRKTIEYGLHKLKMRMIELLTEKIHSKVMYMVRVSIQMFRSMVLLEPIIQVSKLNKLQKWLRTLNCELLPDLTRVILQMQVIVNSI